MADSRGHGWPGLRDKLSLINNMTDVPGGYPIILMVNRNPWKVLLFVAFEGGFGQFDKKMGRS
jgi:hypothetical protein